LCVAASTDETAAHHEGMPEHSSVRPYRWLAEYFDRMFTGYHGAIEAAPGSAPLHPRLSPTS
jgi:hypothetical protein